MERITFVVPRSRWFVSEIVHPPLGVAYLSAILRGLGYKVSVIDGQVLEREAFYLGINKIKDDVVGISITMNQIRNGLEVVKLIRRKLPKTKIILGGPGISFVNYEKFFSSGGDFIVSGEAEIVLPLLMLALDDDLDLLNVPNVFFIRGGKIISSYKKNMRSDLGELPLPDRDNFPLDLYFKRGREVFGLRSLGMITSRGCNRLCIFCDRSISGHKFRARSAREAVKEMDILTNKFLVDKIFIQDESFATDRCRLLEICKMIKGANLKVAWSVLARVDETDEEVITRMKEAGCEDICFGIESGSEKILSFLKKEFSVSQIIDAFEMCRDIGVKAGASFIVGVPGEKKEDINLSVNLVKKIKPVYVDVSFLMPFPGTPLYSLTKGWIKAGGIESLRVGSSIYEYPFTVKPIKAAHMIYGAYMSVVKK